MKCTVVIDAEREEEVLIYAHQKNELVSEIENIVQSDSLELLGYVGTSVIKLTPSEIYYFAIDNGKIFAYTKDNKIQIKQRLYEIEKILNDDFVKVNQSCIVNKNKISRFDASFGGALMITLKNGYRDYVSRRQLKIVKERIGI